MEINYETLTEEQRQQFLDASGFTEQYAKSLSSKKFQLLSRGYGISLPQEPHKKPVDLQEAIASQRPSRPDLSTATIPNEYNSGGEF